jgi:TonB family protein
MGRSEGIPAIWRWAAAAAVSWIAGAALADPPAGASGDTPPQWLHRPTAEDIYSVWPAAAARAGVGGHASMTCIVNTQGGLEECRVESERPEGMGFGAAVLSMAPQFSFRPATHDGQPVRRSVSIPLEFIPPDENSGSLNHIRGEGGPMFTQRVVQNVPWSAAPSFADLAAAYPAHARDSHQTGAAALSCEIGRDGRLHNCDDAGEEPHNAGFISAARRLVGRFQAPVDQPSMRTLVGARTLIHFSFPVEAADASHPVMGQPQWLSQQGDAPGGGYPLAAFQAHVAEGRITLDCTIGAGGHLEQCTAVSEDPAGYGFGAAAVALSAGFVMTLWTEGGLPTIGAHVTVPIHYRLPRAEPAAPAPTAAH